MSMGINNILVVCPQFYDYQKLIKDELEQRYDKVYVFSEYPLGSPTRYFAVAKIPGLSKLLWRLYVRRIVNLCNAVKFDKILIIRGRLLPERLIAFLSRLQCEIIHYQWDSVSNNPNALIISKYASRNFTFDMKDVQMHSEFQYLPLFYCWNGIGNNTNHSKASGVLYLGSWSYERLRLIKEVSSNCTQYGIDINIHLMMSIGEFIERWTKISKDLYQYIRFKTVKRDEYYRMMKECIAVFDAPNKRQVGSSMRTIEALSLGKKVITTNMHVVNEAFFNESNFLLWPSQKDSLKDFINTPFITDSSNKVYSLKQWLNQMGL